MDRNRWKYRIGVLASLASAVLWSTTFISGRYLLRDGKIDPVSLSLFRFLIGGAVLAVLVAATMPLRFLAVSGRDLARLAALSLAGMVGMSVLLFWGQQSTTAVNSAMIMQLNPFLIVLLAPLIGERIVLRQMVGLAAALMGCLLVVNVITAAGFRYAWNGGGDVLILLSATCWALYSVFGKDTVKRYGGLVCSAWTMLFGAAELLLIYPFFLRDAVIPSGIFDWSIVIYVGVFPSALAFWAWYEAMDRIKLSLLNVMQYLTPVFTILLAWLLLGEKLSLLHWSGIGLIAIGIAISGGGGAVKRKDKAAGVPLQEERAG